MVAEPTPQSLRNPVLRHLLATRPPFLLVSAVACGIGWSGTHVSGNSVNIMLAVLTLVAVVLVHAGVNVLNDYYDAVNGTDENNTQRLYPFTGGSRFIQNGVFSLQHCLHFGLGLIAVAALIGMGLALQDRPGLWVIGAVGLLLGWAYSAPPLSLNSRGLGEISVALGFGVLIPVGADYVQRGVFGGQTLMLAVPYALLVTNILFIAQFPDRVADAGAGKNHWVVRLGPQAARWVYVLLALVAYGAVLVMLLMSRLPFVAWWSLTPGILSIAAAIMLLRHADSPQQLAPAIILTILAALGHGIILTLSLML
ncbi:MAG TPA: prenyltransferase [Acidiferrobacteraceae bacterium]|nr:prenyltransferase [Acidiferrobacteraceae bacterium]